MCQHLFVVCEWFVINLVMILNTCCYQTRSLLDAQAAAMEAALLTGNVDAARTAAMAGGLWGPALVLARASPNAAAWTETCAAMCAATLPASSPAHTALTLLGGGPDGVLGGLGEGAWVAGWWRHAAVIAANRSAGDERVLRGMADTLLRGHAMVR